MSKRRLRWGYAFSALLAVIGAGIIRYDQVTDHFWTGLLLVQLSNITFAIGMVGYKRLMELARCRSITPLRGSILARSWWQ